MLHSVANKSRHHPTAPLRIVLADDHPLIAVAMARILDGSTEFELVGEASDGEACLTLVEKLRPDILVLDVVMPQLDGEQVALRTRQRHPGVKIMAFSGHTDQRLVSAMIRAGADAYVTKGASAEEILTALRAVMKGQSYLSAEITGAVMRPAAVGTGAEGAVPPQDLGKRETEVLRLIAEGYQSSGIATALGIAVGTVHTHRRNILRKLDLHSAADLTRYAIREGLTSA